MSRFIHGGHRPPPKEAKPVEKPKPGQYTGEHLANAKKIITPQGGKR